MLLSFSLCLTSVLSLAEVFSLLDGWKGRSEERKGAKKEIANSSIIIALITFLNDGKVNMPAMNANKILTVFFKIFIYL